MVESKSYQFECLTQKNDGSVSIKIWNSQKPKKYKFQNAQKDGIHLVLYAGITGGANCQVIPPLLRNAEEIARFQKMQTSFFSKNGDWQRFVNQYLSEKMEIMNNQKIKTFEISISKNLLRKYLEDQKIIQSLTTGF